MKDLILPIILLVIALAVFALEAFVPSAGVLSLTALAALVAAVVMAYLSGGPVVGTLFLLVVVVILPLGAAVLVHWWPRTWIGRRILIQPRDECALLPDSSALRALVGRQGRAECDMLPSGAVRIDGRSYDAISEGIAIDKGTLVDCIAVKANRVIVRPAEAVEASPPSAAPPDRAPSPSEPVLPDPFDDSLA